MNYTNLFGDVEAKCPGFLWSEKQSLLGTKLFTLLGQEVVKQLESDGKILESKETVNFSDCSFVKYYYCKLFLLLFRKSKNLRRKLRLASVPIHGMVNWKLRV